MSSYSVFTELEVVCAFCTYTTEKGELLLCQLDHDNQVICVISPKHIHSIRATALVFVPAIELCSNHNQIPKHCIYSIIDLHLTFCWFPTKILEFSTSTIIQSNTMKILARNHEVFLAKKSISKRWSKIPNWKSAAISWVYQQCKPDSGV